MTWDGAYAANFCSTKKLISSWQRLLKKMSVEQMRRKRRARLNGIVRLV